MGVPDLPGVPVCLMGGKAAGGRFPAALLSGRENGQVIDAEDCFGRDHLLTGPDTLAIGPANGRAPNPEGEDNDFIGGRVVPPGDVQDRPARLR